jgi:hypothetical protein
MNMGEKQRIRALSYRYRASIVGSTTMLPGLSFEGRRSPRCAPRWIQDVPLSIEDGRRSCADLPRPTTLLLDGEEDERRAVTLLCREISFLRR